MSGFYKKHFLPIITVLFVFLLSYSQEIPDNEEVLESAVSTGKLVAGYWINNSHASVHSNHYADGCSYYGACLFGDALNDSSYYKTVYERYTAHIPYRIPKGNVDSNAIGILPLHLYLHSQNRDLLDLGISAAEDAINHGGYKRNAIDDTYMTGSLMVQAYRATQDSKYIDFCVDYMLHYMGRLQQSNGLYHHRDGGPHCWGRGNGWGAASTTELIQVIPENHPKYNDIIEGYRNHMKGLIDVQKNNGMWMQLLDSKNPANWEETSCMGMFLFAMFTGLRMGLLDEETFLDPAKKGWKAVLNHISSDGRLRDIAVGMWGGQNESDYLNVNHNDAGNAHGTAGFLWAATAAIKYFKTTNISRRNDNLSIHIQNNESKMKRNGRYFDLMGRSKDIILNQSVLPLNTGIYIRKSNAKGSLFNYLK